MGIPEVTSLDESPQPFMYFAFHQSLKDIALDPVRLLVRTDADPEHLVPMLRDRLRNLDPQVPLYGLTTFSEHVRELAMPQRMGVTLFGFFSLLALTLATLGIYGVTSCVAAMRTREIGIRVALGADRPSIRRLVLREGAAPVAIGIVSGVALALWTGRLAAKFIYGVSPSDPLTFAAVAAIMGLVALVATDVPARRAANVDPMVALRHE